MEIDWKKKYNEALEKIKRYTIDDYGCTRLKPTDIFPELAESEDERTRKGLLEVIRHCYEDGGYALCTNDYKKYSDYLEKQKEESRKLGSDYSILSQKEAENTMVEFMSSHKFQEIKEEQKSEWSKEDERMLSRCIKSVESSKNFAETQTFKEAKDKEKDWLKSLPERFNLQTKQEWSDEDKWTIDLTIAVLRENLPNGYFKSTPTNDQNIGAIHTEELVKKLESLKNRGNSPKSNTNSPWKPSEEQMNALKRVVYNRPIGSAELNSLESLYNDLKKLM